MFSLHHQCIHAVLLIKSLARSNIDQTLYCGVQCAFASCSWTQGRIQHGFCSQGTRSGTDWGLNQQWLQKLPVHAHIGGLAFLFPQAPQMPAISISTKYEPLIWKKEIIHGEGYTKDIRPCFVREGVQFFFNVSAFSMSVVATIIFGTTCNSSYLLVYYLGKIPVKNLTRIQLL